MTVRFKPLGKTESENLSAIFRVDPLLLSRVEAGEPPGELVDKLKRGGIDLIPRRWKDMHRECSCPDWGDPCKHMAAVYYLLAKEIDQDPRILFALRGIDLGAFAGSGTATRIGATDDLDQPLPDPFTSRLETEGEDEFIPFA